jgi:glyoxylase-like metal-dependent hydrolase (beta-lactamase superfamily II)
MQIQIGRVELHLLNDGIVWLDGGGVFGLVPRLLWEKLLPADEYNRVPLSLYCLLIHSEGKTILVDSGLGDQLDDKQRLHWGLSQPAGGLTDALARQGVQPEAIDIVINTHLHADHCGGNMTRRGQPEQVAPTFPAAEYWIQRLEWADAAFPNERTRAAYLQSAFAPVQATGQLCLLSGDTRVTGEVRTVITRGHTRAHQSVVIESEGETALYVGDLATLAVHFERLPWVTAYDVEPLETIETKRSWQRWALERNALLIFPHDTQIPMAYLEQYERGKMQLRPFNSAPTRK